MNKKIALLLSILLSINAFAMHQQQQHQHEQNQQTQQKKDTQKQHSHEQQPEEDDVLADLKADMAAVMQTVIQQGASVDNFINQQNAQKKKRIILCEICFKPECPCSQEVYE
jgi:hypothetical protein